MPASALTARYAPLVLAGSAAAASLYAAPLGRRDDPPVATSTSINFTNVADPFNFDVVDLYGDNVIIYTANVTVDGQSYEVQLDTGSSDFWLNTQNNTLSSQAVDTNISVTIAYGDKTVASGDVFIASTQFGNFSIPSQAFINAPGSNATSSNDLGLLGLSSANISQVYNSLQNTSFNGLPPLYNIFNAQPGMPNIITFLLARSNLGITDGGIFTVGAVDPNWSAVLNETQIPVVGFEAMPQWVGLMDGMVVDGKNFTGHGLLAKKKSSSKQETLQTLSVLDTGTATGELPQYYWDAIYKDIPGFEVIDQSLGLYSVPCGTKRNVSMVFNGTEYPMNPLDLTRVSSLGSFSDGSNQTVCLPSFYAQDNSAEGYDSVLGDAFMRNVYALFSFGNWSTVGAQPPYMQLLSTTNQSAAWEQFDDLNNARIQQWNQLKGQYNITGSAGP